MGENKNLTYQCNTVACAVLKPGDLESKGNLKSKPDVKFKVTSLSTNQKEQ